MNETSDAAPRACNEIRRRGRDWVEGVWIALDNGERWSFRKPTLEFRAQRGEGGKLAFTKTKRCCGPGFDELVEEFLVAGDALARVELRLAFAERMLLANYDLDDAELTALLPLRGEQANRDMWDAIVDCALGNSPKAMASGSEPS